MSETTYMRSYTQIFDSITPDDLIAGYYTGGEVLLTGGAGLKRGTLLMSSGDNTFTPATKEGVPNAYELAILSETVPDDADEYGASVYFNASVNGECIILPYETETDIHSELIEAIRPAMRHSGFTVL